MVNNGGIYGPTLSVDDMYRFCTGCWPLFARIGETGTLGPRLHYTAFISVRRYGPGSNIRGRGLLSSLVVQSTDIDTLDDTLPPD
jgi:hypothetical protein